MTWIKANRATGMGSLPHQEESEILSLIAKCLPYWPHWPQLPGNSLEEGFILQYVQPLVKLGLLKALPGKEPYFTRGDFGWDDKLVRFYELYLAFLKGDKEAESFFSLNGKAFTGLNLLLNNFSTYFPKAEGVKGQLSGPLTIGLEIKDEGGRSAFYDEALRELLVKCLTTQAMMQARKLKSTGLPVLIFIDDPSIFLLGSATHITLNEKDITQALTEIITPLKQIGVRVGVHACSRLDWSILLDLPLDVVSFDAYNFFPSMALYSDSLQNFLLRGGRLAWGIVPTSEVAWKVNIKDLLNLFSQQREILAEKRVDLNLLAKNIIWTPSCGTGILSQELAEHIYNLLLDFSNSL